MVYVLWEVLHSNTEDLLLSQCNAITRSTTSTSVDDDGGGGKGGGGSGSVEGVDITATRLGARLGAVNIHDGARGGGGDNRGDGGDGGDREEVKAGEVGATTGPQDGRVEEGDGLGRAGAEDRGGRGRGGGGGRGE